MESYRLGGSLLERFWGEVERCHPQLSENVDELRHTDYSSSEDSVQIFLDDIDVEDVDFGPVFVLAADLFTHIALAFMNSEADLHWKFLSPAPTITPSTPEHRDEDLKVLAMKRDGTSCPVSEVPYYGLGGVDPILTHVIPCSPETMDCISIIAGKVAMDSVLSFSNTVDNVLAMEPSVASSHRANSWGLEARERPGDVNHAIVRINDLQLPLILIELQYYFKAFEPEMEHRVGPVFLRDGDEIVFGQGPGGAQYRNGPHPLLCNLRLAVGRALYTSGAAEFINQLMHDADDIDHPHVAFQDKDFHEVLNAKLLICGRAQIV
ncbi:hypothetical protein H0H87_011227 [Tephrocybe sp. NHM501043]|nr:hypothetical protein H0H87_011227 [Tephrocybe sp. NHM501043]